MMRFLLILFLLLCACDVTNPPAETRRTIEIETEFDTFLDEGNPNSDQDADQTVKFSTRNTELVPVLKFSLPSLHTAERIDSAHVRVDMTNTNVASCEYHVYEVLRSDVDGDTCTWNAYKAGSNWQSDGAWGPEDIDKSTNYGYGANGQIYQANTPILPGEPNGQEHYIARGSGFAKFINENRGSTVLLAWHEKQVDCFNGMMEFASLEHSTHDPPTLILYLTQPSIRRRAIMYGD